jgi:cob(I)alamin adenosyltransferase
VQKYIFFLFLQKKNYTMKIYTKTGDKGQTSLADGTRVSKSSMLLTAYGTVDELNSHIGVLLSMEADEFLTEVQRQLFCLGGMLATPPEKWEKFWEKFDIAVIVSTLEHKIDEMTQELPPFRGFILPQGNAAIAQAHVCRTVCRRAEREVVALYNEDPRYEQPLHLLNRLSDFFFTLARFYHKKMNVPEILW